MANSCGCRGQYFEVISLIILYIFTPGYYVYWTAYILPDIVKYLKLGFPTLTLVFCVQTFFFINAFANMVLNNPQKTRRTLSILRNGPDCQTCTPQQAEKTVDNSKTEVEGEQSKVVKPKPARHNKRHSLLFITYLALTCLSSATWTSMLMLAELGPQRLTIEMKAYVETYPNYPSLIHGHNYCLSFLLFSLLGVVSVGPIACYHFWNTLKGDTGRGPTARCTGFSNWRGNLEKVFGKRWRMALVWPFTESPLPD